MRPLSPLMKVAVQPLYLLVVLLLAVRAFTQCMHRDAEDRRESHGAFDPPPPNKSMKIYI